MWKKMECCVSVISLAIDLADCLIVVCEIYMNVRNNQLKLLSHIECLT